MLKLSMITKKELADVTRNLQVAEEKQWLSPLFEPTEEEKPFSSVTDVCCQCYVHQAAI